MSSVEQDEKVNQMVEGTEPEEGLDNEDGLLRKKKKNKNKVKPDEKTDVVTSAEEKDMSLKKVLELEKELLDMRSEKDNSDDQVRGLKYELTGLQSNFQELQETSTKSLEELERFEVKRLTEQAENAKKENVELATELETTKTQQIADQKERDTLRVELKAKLEELEQLKVDYERAQKQVQEMEKTNSEAKKQVDEAKESLKEVVERMKQDEESLKEKLKTLETTNKERFEKTNIEKDSLLKELNEERERARVSVNEVTLLKNEIEKMVVEKEEEKKFRLKIAERLKMLIDEKSKMEAAYKCDLKQVETDFEDLKKHLMHVTTGKAEIFQKLSDLVMERSQKQRWVDDKETSNCTNCRAKFSFTLRRHHCRLCGHIFCNSCSDRWLLTPHSSKCVRSCDVCADAYTETHENSEKEERDVDCVDAPPQKQYQELIGDEIEKYEKEEEEEEELNDHQGETKEVKNDEEKKGEEPAKPTN